MKNIFVEEIGQDDLLLEELIRDSAYLEYYSKKENLEAIEYYQNALLCDQELVEEMRGNKLT